MVGPAEINAKDLTEYHRKIVNNLGYFAMSRTRIRTNEEVRLPGNDESGRKYILEDTSPLALFIYWIFYINTAIKAVYLAFVTMGHFGPLEWTDKIANADYILCVGIVTFGSFIWFRRYPIYEVFHNLWKVENSIFASLSFSKSLKAAVNKDHFITVWAHLVIVWGGCTILVTQFFGDPKYIIWTYSCIETDTLLLRIIFCVHEFLFMMHPWNNMTGSSSLCAFHGIIFSNIIDEMTVSMESLRKMSYFKKLSQKTSSFKERNLRVSVGTEKGYTLEKLILDYKKLMLISDLFNSWVSYKIVALHTCGYFQFISDVFVAMQVLKLPGTGIMDVWFYIEDSLASMYVIYRVYTFMSHVKPASIRFLRMLNLSIAEVPDNEKRRLWKTFRSLKTISLKLGPSPVTPMTVLKALELLSSYYICVALWD